MTAPRWSVVAPLLKTFLETIPGVGIVHDHFPRVTGLTDSPEFKSTFTKDGKVNFLVFRRMNSQPEKVLPDDVSYSRLYQIELLWYFSYSDAGRSEVPFQDLVDAATETFEALVNRSMGSVINTFSVINWAEIKPVKWYGKDSVLTSHFARGLFDVEVFSD